MRRPQRMMPDITEERIASLLEDGEVRSVSVKGNQPTLATGDMRAHQVLEGVLVMSASLSGQKAYEAQVIALPGLTFEVRMEGVSSSAIAAKGSDWMTVEPGDFVISACQQPTEYLVTAPSQSSFKTLSISLDEDFLQKLKDPELIDLSRRLCNGPNRIVAPAPVQVVSLAERFLHADPNQPLARTRMLAGCLDMAAGLAALAQEDSAASSAYDEQVLVEAKAYIADRSGAGITISDVAAHCKISASTLKPLFRASEGVSIGAYTRTVRMEAARSMVSDNVPIAEVASLLKYSAPEAFSRAFARHFGVPPSQI